MAKLMQIPDVFKFYEPNNLQNKFENIGIIAVDKSKNFHYIPERYIEQFTPAQLEENVLKIMTTLIENQWFLAGILYVGNISYDHNISTIGFLGKKQIPEFVAIWEKYQTTEFPKQFDSIVELDYQFVGKYQELFEKINPKELLGLYGSLFGIITINSMGSKNPLQPAIDFQIISQNVSNTDETFRPIIDVGIQDNLQRKIQEKTTIPVCEFRVDLGWNSFFRLVLWSKISSNAAINKSLLNYKEYLSAHDEFEDQSSVNLIPESEIELKQNLDDMKSTIDELASQMNFDAVVRQIYNPPPTLFGYSTSDGIDIGGSLCFISFGTGGNLIFDSEITRMVMFGKYMKRLKGNPQIESMTMKEEIRVKNSEQFDQIINNIFDPLKLKKQIFLGTLEIEANGFESVVFRDLTLKESDLNSLASYYHESRLRNQNQTYQPGQPFEVKFFGDECNIFTDPRSYGCSEFAHILDTTPWYTRGVLMGIICIGSNRVYFYFLANNFGNEENSDYGFVAKPKTMELMFSHIDMMGLTPVSWFKISFGIEFLKSIELQEAVQIPVDFPQIQFKYLTYIKELEKNFSRGME